MIIIKRLIGGALAIAVLAAVPQAEARIGDYTHGYGVGRSDNAGNNNYGASFNVSSTQRSRQHTGSTFERASYATQVLSVDTRLFGRAENLAYGRTFAQGAQIVWGTDLSKPPQYGKSASIELRIMDDVKISKSVSGQSNCNENGNFSASFTACVADTEEWLSRTFYKNEQTFIFAGFIPITVRSRITGTVESVFSARAGAKQLNNTVDQPPTFRGDAEVKVDNNAYVTCTQEAIAGIEGVFGLEVEGRYRMIDLSITPVAQASQSADKSQSAVSYRNQVAMDLTTLSGRVDIKFNYLIDSYRKNLVSWKGFTLGEAQTGPVGTVYVN